MVTKGILTVKEIEAAQRCLELSQKAGADQARITLDKSIREAVNILDGDVDGITHSEDCFLDIELFVNGRYGDFSTNLTEDGLDKFIENSLKATEYLSEDSAYGLPEEAEKAQDAKCGDEMKLFDESFFELNELQRLEFALENSVGHKAAMPAGITLESEDTEFCQVIADTMVIDSAGFVGRISDTAFNYSTEVTVKDSNSDKYSNAWWDSSVFFKDLEAGTVGQKAIELALKNIGARKIASGKYNTVIDTNVAVRLMRPILDALDAYAVYLDNSFFKDCLGKDIFGKEFTLMDKARERGKVGSVCFDGEGTATYELPLIENGVIKNFYSDCFSARKSGFKHTFGKRCRPWIAPFICNSSKKEINLNDIMRYCDRGIYITDFNGGNCNPVTGDYSYGVSGFVFENGELIHPVKEVLLTGNIVDTFGKLISAGSDQRKCMRYRIPSLAFEGLDINA